MAKKLAPVLIKKDLIERAMAFVEENAPAAVELRRAAPPQFPQLTLARFDLSRRVWKWENKAAVVLIQQHHLFAFELVWSDMKARDPFILFKDDLLSNLSVHLKSEAAIDGAAVK